MFVSHTIWIPCYAAAVVEHFSWIVNDYKLSSSFLLLQNYWIKCLSFYIKSLYCNNKIYPTFYSYYFDNVFSVSNSINLYLFWIRFTFIPFFNFDIFLRLESVTTNLLCLKCLDNKVYMPPIINYASIPKRSDDSSHKH